MTQPPPEPSAPAALVSLRGITKRFGDRLALDGVDLVLAPGEIHALLGDGGAGKSTLVEILGGIIQPTAGDVAWEGRGVTIPSPVAARRLGVGIVFQNMAPFDGMTVAENVAVTLPERRFDALRTEIAEVSRAYGLALEPDRAVRTLSAGERRRIEIVRCLLAKPRLLVLDEPTSVFTPQEAERLFETLTRLSEEGIAILYVSRKCDEVRRFCRAATILRAGKVVETLDPRARSAREIEALAVGSEIGEVRAHRPKGTRAEVYREEVFREEVLRVENLALAPDGLRGRGLRDVSFTVGAGEIVGIAGIAGNGQSDLFAAISGERLAPAPGDVVIAGAGVGRLGIDARRRLGAAFVPEERLGHAAAPTRTLSENTVLSHHATSGLVRAGFIAFGEARKLARSVVSHFDVSAPSGDPAARRLSGGDLQKFVVGREILRGPKLLVLDQPTRGVDAGAARLIRRALVDLAAKGAAVLVISGDLDELFEIAHRLGVLLDGRLSGVRPTAEWTPEAVGLAMTEGDAGEATGEGRRHAAPADAQA